MRIKTLLEQDSNKIQLPIWRGLTWEGEDPEPGDSQIIQIRQDRRPRDTSIIFSVFFNLGIHRSLGIDFIRGQGLFCSTSIDQAGGYAATLYDYGANSVVAQIKVSPSASVVYKPGVGDSLVVEQFMDKNLNPVFDFMMTNGADIEDLPGQLLSTYLTTPSDQAVRSAALACNLPQEKLEDFMQIVYALTDKMATGYQSVNAGAFKNPGHDVECIVIGVKEFEAVVEDWDEEWD